MKNVKSDRFLRLLTGYYGILQSCHLIFLARAGLLYLNQGRVPFPASPPPGGWPGEVIPYLMGMGAVDVVAASLGIYFSLSLLFGDRLRLREGLISLTIALCSGVLYLVGTLPSGAWGANPLSYLIVILVFSPVLPLAFLVFKRAKPA